MKQTFFLLLLSVALLTPGAKAQTWKSKTAPMMTKFAADVDPNNVLPEYPRPQMQRSEWMNLNGLWEYQPGTWENEGFPKGKLKSNILVPFAVESALSGVMEYHERLWYRRTFTVPSNWNGKDVILNFGAVDYFSEVFINGRSVGKHQGGYDSFSFNITPYLKGSGEQTITVKVYDPTTKEGYPRGKQSLNQYDIMYTPVTGIWQTVWLEPVSKVKIDKFDMVPDIDNSELDLLVHASGSRYMTYKAEVKDGNKTVATYTGTPSYPAKIKINNQKLWSPDSPFLYDMTLTLYEGDKVVDVVDTYFGMRKIAIENDGEFQRMYLNNEFVFQMGPLDQGYWPDGLYTAPTDEALKYDLEITKELGYNMTRKHIKVEPMRWYYWADKLGLMVWQDMPSPNSYTANAPKPDKEAYTNELISMIEQLKNVPSIVMWVIFNEGQGQHDTQKYVAIAKGLDPSRLVNEASGGGHRGYGDVYDMHSYPPPVAPKNTYRATACGEYGGIGYQYGDKLWNPDDLKEYVSVKNEDEYMEMYNEFATMLTKFKTNEGLSAAVYTEITDVEIELNGIMTYERILKLDPKKIAKANHMIIHDNMYEYIYDVLPTAESKDRKWKYTFEKPSSKWKSTKYNDKSWKTGMAGFGDNGAPASIVNTKWTTDEIWLRQEFELGNLSDEALSKLMLRIHHDDDCEVYINGVEAAVIPKWSSNYINVEISDKARKSLKLNGKNVIAVYCKQRTGGQYIDAGLSVVSDTEINELK